MRFSSTISTATDLAAACAEAAQKAMAELSTAADIGFVFVSAEYGALDRVPDYLADVLGDTRLFGCSGGGVLAAGKEVEGKRAVSITLASLPGAVVHMRHIEDDMLPGPDAAPSEWREAVGGTDDIVGMIVIPEPMSCDPDRLLTGLDYAYPSVPKSGGMASGSLEPMANSLFVESETLHSGLAILTFSGDIEMEVAVAQGCRAIGPVGQITRSERNLLVSIDNKTSLTYLQEMLTALPSDDVELVRRSPMFLGIAVDPFAGDKSKPGEFLIRNILGIDRSSGTLSIGARLGVGRLVRFYLRDKSTSTEDLREVLECIEEKPEGALLFSCLGRGEQLYGEAGHDSRVFDEVVGPVPVGGFFCNGEIGPVGGETFLHGFTSAFALFRPKS